MPDPTDWFDDRRNVARLIQLLDRHDCLHHDVGCAAVDVVERPWRWQDEWLHLRGEPHDPTRCVVCRETDEGDDCLAGARRAPFGPCGPCAQLSSRHKRCGQPGCRARVEPGEPLCQDHEAEQADGVGAVPKGGDDEDVQLSEVRE